MENNKLIKYALTLCILFLILAIVLFEEVSFWFLGISISIIGFIMLYKINQ